MTDKFKSTQMNRAFLYLVLAFVFLLFKETHILFWFCVGYCGSSLDSVWNPLKKLNKIKNKKGNKHAENDSSGDITKG